MGYKLKPCPFCGGQAELDSKQAFREFVSGKISDAVAVYCTKCSAEISVCVPDVPDIQPEQLVDMWNTQSPVEDLSALIEKCEKALKTVPKIIDDNGRFDPSNAEVDEALAAIAAHKKGIAQ